mmetsp:Transcript_27324/g.37652  ORF Transcript_27324/g.37652 Transcript_27324/m.37652 type:complete len:235 (+) Transcript_27324:445-1149(+)
MTRKIVDKNTTMIRVKVVRVGFRIDGMLKQLKACTAKFSLFLKREPLNGLITLLGFRPLWSCWTIQCLQPIPQRHSITRASTSSTLCLLSWSPSSTIYTWPPLLPMAGDASRAPRFCCTSTGCCPRWSSEHVAHRVRCCGGSPFGEAMDSSPVAASCAGRRTSLSTSRKASFARTKRRTEPGVTSLRSQRVRILLTDLSAQPLARIRRLRSRSWCLYWTTPNSAPTKPPCSCLG